MRNLTAENYRYVKTQFYIYDEEENTIAQVYLLQQGLNRGWKLSIDGDTVGTFTSKELAFKKAEQLLAANITIINN